MRRDFFEPTISKKKNAGEEAKKSLEALKRQKALASSTIVIQVRLRQRSWRRLQAVRLLHRAANLKLQSRLRDIAVVKAKVGERLQFLPMAALLEMLTLLKLSKDGAQAKELSGWVLMSLKGRI